MRKMYETNFALHYIIFHKKIPEHLVGRIHIYILIIKYYQKHFLILFEWFFNILAQLVKREQYSTIHSTTVGSSRKSVRTLFVKFLQLCNFYNNFFSSFFFKIKIIYRVIDRKLIFPPILPLCGGNLTFLGYKIYSSAI